jgi:hypothetical protein
MLAKVYSCALVGLEGAVVEVEADLNPRALPSVTLVGLPDAAVKESTERDLQLRADLSPRPAHGQPGSRRSAQGGPRL